MDFAPDTPEDDAAALAIRRANLRAFVEDVVEVVRNLPMPDTYLEAERSVRVVTVADRFIVRVPDEEDDLSVSSCGGDEKKAVTPARKALRRYADQLMAAVARIPKPDSYLEGERAARYALACDRMLVQLYTAPKADTSVADDSDADDTSVRTDAYGRGPSIFITKYKGKKPADWRTNTEFWRDLLAEKLVRMAQRRGTPHPVELPASSVTAPLPPATPFTTEPVDSPIPAEPRIRTFDTPFRPPP